MKSMKITISTKLENGTKWELKDCEYSIPETLKEWTEYLGEEKIILTLETYDGIRRQDAGRRAKVGGKTLAPLSDWKIRKEIVPGFKLFERTRVSAEKRDPKEQILAQEREKALADVRAMAEALGISLDEIVGAEKKKK